MRKTSWIAVVVLHTAAVFAKDNAAEAVYPSVWAPPTAVTAAAAKREVPVVIANDRVRLGFQAPDRGLGLASMVLLTNGREAMSAVDARSRWWEIQVRRPDKQILSVTNLQAPPGRFVPFTDRSTGGRFVWENVPVPSASGALTVTVTVRLEPNSPLARLRIAVDNRLKNQGLWKVIFPVLNHLGYPGQSDCMVPSSWGVLNQGELHRGATGGLNWLYQGQPVSDYPSGTLPLQHFSCSIGDGTVVYIGWHDGRGNFKGYNWKVEDGLAVYAWPPNMTVPGVGYVQDWDCVVGPMKGDWFDAAAVYRAWAIKQFWCVKGRLEDRTDQPKAFFEIPYWGDPNWPHAGFQSTVFPDNARASTLVSMFRPGKGLDPNARAYDVQSREMVQRAARAIERYGLPQGLQWYGWHKARFDGNYPDYFPPRPGFAEVLGQMKRPRLFVHGFINGIWFDRSLPGFKEAAPYAIMDADEASRLGRVNPVMYSVGHALMCPATKYWQDKMAHIAGEMAKLGFQGAYLDVLANAGCERCFDPRHGHAIGAGPWFVQATRKLVDGTKGPGKLQYIASECFNETLGQSVDLFYTCSEWRPDTAPLLGSIYAGYFQWYGLRAFKKIHDDTDEDDVSFLAKLTRTVFWGGQPSLYCSWEMADGQEWAADQFSKFIALKRQSHKYLTYGTMVRPPAFARPVPRLTAPRWSRASRSYEPVTMDAVERAAWRASDGSVAVFLMNYDAKPLKAVLDLTSVNGLEPKGKGRVLEVDLAARQPIKVDFGQIRAEGDRQLAR